MVSPDQVLAMRDSLQQVEVEESILGYVVALLTATREHPQVTVGASPRGGLATIALSRGAAILAGRDYVTPEDVKAVASSALAHRITVKPELWLTRASGATVTDEVLSTVPTPSPGGAPSV